MGRPCCDPILGDSRVCDAQRPTVCNSVMGRAEDRGARCASGAIMVRAFRCAPARARAASCSRHIRVVSACRVGAARRPILVAAGRVSEPPDIPGAASRA